MSNESFEQTFDVSALDDEFEFAADTGAALENLPVDLNYDEFLMLLVARERTLPRRLETLRTQLLCLADDTQPDRLRARAAVAIGRNAQERKARFAELWFKQAMGYGSVVGVWETARQLLAEDKIEIVLGDALLPRLTRVRDVVNDRSDALAYCSPNVAEHWYKGAVMALDQMRKGFAGWERDDFEAAHNCVLCWLTLLPRVMPAALRRVSPTTEEMLAQRRHALDWLMPLWRAIDQNLSRHARREKRENAHRLRQMEAARLFLENGTTNDAVAREITPCEAERADSVVVVRGKIAASTDQQEAVLLKQYERLREPVRLVQLPDSARLDEIARTLVAEFPWAADVVGRALSEPFARQRLGATRLGMRPLLLVGEPGSGKTRFAQRLSELLGTPNTVINMAGMSDVKVLKGLARGWAGNRPSRLVEFIEQTGVANPLFILDEVDKTGRHAHSMGGNPHDALLDLLEAGNARRYSDIYLMTECDLSHCMFVATANSLLALPRPLLSRFELAYFPAPGPEHTEVLVEGVMRDLEAAWALPAGAMSVSRVLIDRLRGLGPREIRRALVHHMGDSAADARYARH